jgi:hypothetical protein
MAQKPAAHDQERLYLESFLTHLNDRLARPTAEWPSARCWTERSLKKLFKHLREELSQTGVHSNMPHHTILNWLCRLRLVTQLPVEGEAVYLLEIGSAAEWDVDPFELLLAAQPKGVVCYFSALAYYSLTTQHVEHHHVAELQPQASLVKKRVPAVKILENSRNTENAETIVRRGPARYGSLLFRFQDIPFYLTRRSTRLIPGIQTRAHGPRSQIRITTLVQTLIDTLQKPFHCGGPEVVFEAWREAVARGSMDEDRLVSDLQNIDSPAISRRVGVMLEIVGANPGNTLKRFLDQCRAAITRNNPFIQISLLPGIEYQNLNTDWCVNVP